VFPAAFRVGGKRSPLGLEIGVADLATVKAKLEGQTRLTEAGINKWTQGPMLKSNGEGLDVEGLKEITFIFGQDEKLDGVIMILDKDRLKEVTAALGKKYKKVRENIPFVSDALALYRQGDSIVRVEAPHLSFVMQVLYLSNRLQEAFEKGSRAEEAERRRHQADKF
jgi:hypothetical protein